LHAEDSHFLVMAEHMVRTNILLVTYWMLEANFEPEFADPVVFFSDDSHIFLTGVIFFLGLLIGGANVASERHLRTLKSTAAQLRKYSEWLLGKEILSRAVDDPEQLALKRQERCMLFLDIRGFTAWSETRSPEEVVGMLNDCFALAETVWSRRPVVKSKFTGDEVMLVLPDPAQALLTARELVDEIGEFLKGYGLACGIGLHHGPLVEGLLGSREVKAFDVIGDTVNTAKRICDQAGAGELLISQAMFERLDGVRVQQRRELSAKGKDAPVVVYLCND
jgi:class 3 adenylate cyclase